MKVYAIGDSWDFLVSVGLFGHATCRILVPGPGIKPMPPEMEVQGLNHWIARNHPIGNS